MRESGPARSSEFLVVLRGVGATRESAENGSCAGLGGLVDRGAFFLFVDDGCGVVGVVDGGEEAFFFVFGGELAPTADAVLAEGFGFVEGSVGALEDVVGEVAVVGEGGGRRWTR